MVYEWKSGSRHKVSADIAGAVCEELESKQSLNAETLVEVSRPEDAPLHSEFEWDDNKAAEQWRNQQARSIINSLTVVAHDNIVTRKFFNVVPREHNYTSIEVIVQSADGRESLLRKALEELKWFKKKYQSLSKLSEVFEKIDELTEEGEVE